MKNFVNVRVQSTNNLKISNRIKHNLRHIKSLNTQIVGKNVLVGINSPITKEIPTKTKSRYTYYKKMYDNDRTIHNERYKKNNGGRNVRDLASSWGEGVITFSERIHQDLGKKYSQEELFELSREYIKKFENQFETKVKMVIFHTDEKTPHFHFFFENYDETGKSIVWKNRDRKSLSKLQDIAGETFGKIGMNRGIKKSQEDCGVYDYKTTKQYKQEQLIEIQNIQDKIKQNIEDLKSQRKDIRDDITLSIEDKKDLYSEITHKQTILRNINKKIKQYKTIKKHLTPKEDTKYKKEIKTMIDNIDYNGYPLT